MNRRQRRVIPTPRSSDLAPAAGPVSRHPALDLFRTLPGRLFLLSGGLLILLRLVQAVATLPDIVDLFRRVVALALITASVWLLVLAWVRHRQHLLWRVRRKLILSYVLLGVVPVALIAALTLAVGIVLYFNVTSYLFRESLHDVEQVVQQAAEAAAAQIDATPAGSDAVLERIYANLTHEHITPRYFQLSLTVVPAKGGTTPRPLPVAGSWQHLLPPTTIPPWALTDGHSTSVLAYDTPARQGEPNLLIRALAATPDRSRIVIADLPVDDGLKRHLSDRTGIEMGTVAVAAESSGLVRMLRGLEPPAPPIAPPDGETPDRGAVLFRRNVVMIPFVTSTFRIRPLPRSAV